MRPLEPTLAAMLLFWKRFSRFRSSDLSSSLAHSHLPRGYMIDPQTIPTLPQQLRTDITALDNFTAPSCELSSSSKGGVVMLFDDRAV